jgi:hypothetical protein
MREGSTVRKQGLTNAPGFHRGMKQWQLTLNSGVERVQDLLHDDSAIVKPIAPEPAKNSFAKIASL